MASGKPGEYSHLLTLSFGQIKLIEDALRHTNELQDHRQFIRDQARKNGKENGGAIGRVPMALNLDHDPTTWSDLGVSDPNHPEAMHAIHNYMGRQGFDEKTALQREAARMRRG